MKDKKHKYLEDLFDEYIQLHDELIEIPVLTEKAQKKFDSFLLTDLDPVYKYSDAEDLYKVFNVLKKHQERKKEIVGELVEVEELLKDFLTSLNGGKVSYEKKDDDKSKITFLFWLEEDKVKCNR